MGKIIGIDLGSTNSRMSYVDDVGVARIIEPAEGGDFTPSVVFIDPTSNYAVVGIGAIHEGALYPECMVENIRYCMRDPDYTFNINEREYSPAAIICLILKKLIADAELWLGDEEIDGVLITCPGWFREYEREVMRFACENIVLHSGEKLNVLQFLNEPVAAALAYAENLHQDMQKTVLIYDLGGSSFDATVMNVNFTGNSRNMEIITTGGDHYFGGRNWDECLGDYVREMFCELTGADPDKMRNDPEMRYWFRENIERAKIMLSQKDRVVLIPYFDGEKVKIEITREIFETGTEHLLDHTIEILNEMLERKGLNFAEDIDEIWLVGGASKMPQVRNCLAREYNLPIRVCEPDKAVAMGAAIVGVISKSDSSKDTKPIPRKLRAGQSIGMKLFVDGKEKILNLVLKGDTLPKTVNVGDYVGLSVGRGKEYVRKIVITLVKTTSDDQFCNINVQSSECAKVEFIINRGIREDEILSLTLFADAAGPDEGRRPVDTLTLFDADGAPVKCENIVWKKCAYLTPVR